MEKIVVTQKSKGGLLKSAQKEKSCKSFDLQDSVRRERDSNPRYLSVRRFSRPVHSTTLPSLHRVLWVMLQVRCNINCLPSQTLCGERGIRTPGTSQYAGFQDRCIRPLCHLSIKCYGRHTAVLGKAICYYL